MSRELKIGLVVTLALVTLAVGTFLVGERSNLFRRTTRYFIHFDTAGGLAEDNPVQLNGVNVGQVERIVLPEDVVDQFLTVWITVDRRFAARVRADSTARIKTLGLLGDKYVDITSGSVQAEQIPDGGEIRAAPATDVDQIIASGEDAVENVVAISSLMRDILTRMNRGEGLLGGLVAETPQGSEAKEAMLATLRSVKSVSEKIDRGQGSLGRLINDATLARELEASVRQLSSVLEAAQSGDGTIADLLHNPETRDATRRVVDDLGRTAESLATFADALGNENSLLYRLLNDEDLGVEMTEDLKALLENLRRVSEKIEGGDGTIGKLIEDPQVYESVNDILVGVNESKLLRWLVRNRQKKGIEVRYEAEQETLVEAQESQR